MSSQSSQMQPSTGGLSSSSHFAKIEAHHNRMAVHRRTQSQFEFKNCNNNNIQIPNHNNANNSHQSTLNVANNNIHTSSVKKNALEIQTTVLQQLSPNEGSWSTPQAKSPSQQQSTQIASPVSPKHQLSYQSQPQNMRQQSPLHSQQNSSQIQQPFSPTQSSQINPTMASMSAMNQFQQQPQPQSPISTQQMIQMMQVKQQLTQSQQHQIVETIEQDFVKFTSPSGFNFGKKIHRLYPQNQIPANIEQRQQAEQPQQQQQQQQQQQYQISSSPQQQASFFGFHSPVLLSNHPNIQNQNCNTGQLGFYTSQGLQPIPEQDVSSAEGPTVSHPSSTRNNQDDKKQASNQQVLQHSRQGSSTNGINSSPQCNSPNTISLSSYHRLSQQITPSAFSSKIYEGNIELQKNHSIIE